MKYAAIPGGALWVALLAGSAMHLVRPSLIELLFLFAPLVVVPLGLKLCAGLIRPETYALPGRIAQRAEFLAALSATLSFYPRPGIGAALLALPWFLFGCLIGLAGLIHLTRSRLPKLRTTCLAVSFLYLPIGCTWLLASRLGMTPMGFQEPIVLLTAVHFHYAGFAAPLLVLAVASAIQREGVMVRRILALVSVGVLASPGLLAAGFVIGLRFKLAMALLVVGSEVGLSLFFLASIRNLPTRLAQMFVSISAMSVLLAMVFAAVWAIGEFLLQPFVHLDEMAKLHGTANALGFVACGLLGWTLATHDLPSSKGDTR